MSRCAYCRGFIWPWQRRGWRMVGPDQERWHTVCWSARLTLRRLLAKEVA